MFSTYIHLFAVIQLCVHGSFEALTKVLEANPLALHNAFAHSCCVSAFHSQFSHQLHNGEELLDPSDVNRASFDGI
jgi:hypothetical protein